MSFYGYDPMAYAQLNMQTRATLGANAANSTADLIKSVGGIIQNAQKAGKENEVKQQAYAQYKALAETPAGQKAGLNIGQVPPPSSPLDAASYVAQLTQKVWPNWSAQLTKAGITQEEVQQAIQMAPQLADTTGLVTRQGQLGMAENLSTQFPTQDVLAADAAKAGFNLNPTGPTTPAPTGAPPAEPQTPDQAVPNQFRNPASMQPQPAGIPVYPPAGQAGPPELVPTSEPIRAETTTDLMASMSPIIRQGLTRGTLSEGDALKMVSDLKLADIKLEQERIKVERERLAALRQKAGEKEVEAATGGAKVYQKGQNEPLNSFDALAMMENPQDYTIEAGKLPNTYFSNRTGGYGNPATQSPNIALNNALIKQLSTTEELQVAKDDYGNTIYRAKPGTKAYQVVNNPRLRAAYAWKFFPDVAELAKLPRPSQADMDFLFPEGAGGPAVGGGV